MKRRKSSLKLMIMIMSSISRKMKLLSNWAWKISNTWIDIMGQVHSLNLASTILMQSASKITSLSNKQDMRTSIRISYVDLKLTNFLALSVRNWAIAWYRSIQFRRDKKILYRARKRVQLISIWITLTWSLKIREASRFQKSKAFSK